jgi:hypothetical protein
MAWWRDAAAWVRASLAVSVCASVAIAGLGSVALPARGEAGPQGGSDAATCPLTGFTPTRPAGEPTTLTAGVGATQSAPAGARFPIRLAVTATDAEAKPVPDALVTFAAPTRGPSGYFTVRSGGANMRLHRVQARTNACGVALAPAFTANRRAGGYIVVASVEHVKAAFALVNEGR